MLLGELGKADVLQAKAEFEERYAALKESRVSLDLTRGKPSVAQLNLSNSLLSLPADKYIDSSGVDVRNYGGLKGINGIREIYGSILGIDVDNIVAGNNASLEIMHYLLTFSLLFGAQDSAKPWVEERAEGKKLKFLCPVPGYDRHFAITETLGFEMINVPINDDGPDMDIVEELVANDPAIKGIWIVPIFSNPSGVTCSEGVTQRLVSMRTAAQDFRIFWDNAYALHTLTDEFPLILDILGMAAKVGNANRPYVFASTSKVTQAGSGVAFLASSTANLDWYLKHLSIATIGPNKVNQLAHELFLNSPATVRQHMLDQKEILAPKFEKVQEILEQRLATYGVAHWTQPKGGYFVSLDVVDGTARRVVELSAEAGIKLTSAGSSFPLHHDPDDRNIRLSPSMPSLEEIETAMHGVATCVLLAAAEARLTELETT